MCGITGIIAFNEEGAKFLSHTDRAIETLNKRGPDSCGSYSHNQVSLGHTRLSIIDTSEAAAQPFTDSTGRYTIVYNGEIYNYKELRKQLIDKGVSFKSEGDTEVLLYLFIEHGENCLKLLNGFFAFAIYDKQKEKLFLARDRIGIKPLLYYLDDDKFIFGSELKALLAYKIPRKLDTISLFTYLQMNYIPSPHSILQNVKKIEPGTFATVDKESNFSQQQYYQISQVTDHIESPALSDYESVKVRLHSLVELAVKDRLEADVPLGTFLSGGIDSSIVTALAAKHKKDIHSFSIGFKDEPFFDETKYAQLVSKKVNTKHTVFSLSNQDLLDHVFEVLDYMDEPFGDSSAIPVNILSKFTKEHVSVALSGDGADEMFAGYNKHYAEFRVRNAGFVNQLLKSVSPLLDLLPQSRNSKIANLSRQINRYSQGAKLKHKERYWKWASILDEEEANYLLKEKRQEKKQRASDEAFQYKKRKEAILKTIRKTGDFNDVLYTDMNLVLKD
ncbi:MAG TPA: asparagine synthase (glutamine-hydrolyzing), partial [Flavobacteriales bacterium]|nr:asparagine synthase (glutamine-hydrolyzing) [Flavobacteriales bacterium]